MDHLTHQPVIVVSPCLRAGTTLVQRLLCSAPNALVYGDGVGQEMEFFARYAAVKEQMLGFQAGTSLPVRTAVLSGNTDDFITTLAPPVAHHVEGLRRAALTWLQVCAEDAARAGRSVWGWKMAGADPVALPRLAHWLPEAKWVWIERDLRDCFRSAKAAGMAVGAEEAEVFARHAAASRAAFAPLVPCALVLSYEEMLTDRDRAVSLLESHTGARGIQRAVFEVKVNTPGVRQIIPPAELTGAEEAALVQIL
jgi:hypothetical protein